jgi:serine/threonine protein kinase
MDALNLPLNSHSSSSSFSSTASLSPTIQKKFIGKYEVIRLLGRGAFGTVKLAVDPSTGEQVSFESNYQYQSYITLFIKFDSVNLTLR